MPIGSDEDPITFCQAARKYGLTEQAIHSHHKHGKRGRSGEIVKLEAVGFRPMYTSCEAYARFLAKLAGLPDAAKAKTRKQAVAEADAVLDAAGI